jgi:hypothetical protein
LLTLVTLVVMIPKKPTGGFGSSDRFSDRPERAEVPFPTAPPYTAFVGNLTFETVDSDLEGFFTGLEVGFVFFFFFLLLLLCWCRGEGGASPRR